MLTLGIETSCDETSVAVLENGTVAASETYTQDVHAQFGGVVPEIASRAHLAKLDRLCGRVLRTANIVVSDVDLVAVTDRPGLAGALLVGISFGLGLHTSRGLPITGVNHLEGHLCSAMLDPGWPPFPFLALAVSGGHTALYRVRDFGDYQCLGQTADDAAGEAFDKVGKLLGFPYPAGRDIEREARSCAGATDLRFPLARTSSGALDFSFSGLKTAVKYHLQGKDVQWLRENRGRMCCAVQDAIVGSLVRNTVAASQQLNIKSVVCVGGVACNGRLRHAMQDAFGEGARFPAPKWCTDNAAMVARAGYERHQRGTGRFPSMSPSADP